MAYDAKRPRPRTTETDIGSLRDVCRLKRRHAHATNFSESPPRKIARAIDPCPVRASPSAAPCSSSAKPTSATTTPRRDRSRGTATGASGKENSSCGVSTTSGRASIVISPPVSTLGRIRCDISAPGPASLSQPVPDLHLNTSRADAPPQPCHSRGGDKVWHGDFPPPLRH